MKILNDLSLTASIIKNAADNSTTTITGGTTGDTGANVVLHGPSLNSGQGLLRSGGTNIAMWNSSGFHIYNSSNVVLTTGDVTIGGTKTFSTIPVLPASNPTTDNQAVRKAYVDSQVSGINTGVMSVAAGTGTTVGGTATNRTVNVTYGTAANTAAQGNDARIVNATPNTRTITAGDGLSGGGTLAADRTLTVDSTVVRTSGDQTIGGVKTHTSIPVLPASDPTTPNQATRRAYVDSVAVPVGGTTGQVLAKSSNTDRDTEWTDPPAGFDPLSYTPVVIGDGADIGTAANPETRTAAGVGAQATGHYASAFGQDARATGSYSSVFGQDAQATGANASAFGAGAAAASSDATAFGQSAQATGSGASAFGRNARANASNPLRIKYGTNRTLNYSTDEEALWTATDSTNTAGSGTRRYHPHSEEIIRIRALTQTEYDAIASPDAATLYVILDD